MPPSFEFPLQVPLNTTLPSRHIDAWVPLGLASVAVNQALVSLLYGVTATHLTTYLLTASLILAVSIVAVSVPASRAMRVDPSVTLGYC
jgi:hypothetical protein